MLRTALTPRSKARLGGALSSASLLALAAGFTLGGPAWANGGNGQTSLGGSPSGLGGVDGSQASATGQDGPPGATSSLAGTGGGGALDLTTGNGAPGGAQGVFGSASPGAAPAAPGAPALTASSPTAIATTTTGAAGSGAAVTTGAVAGSGGGGGGVAVSATADVTVAATGVVTGGRGGGSNPSGAGGGAAGLFSSANVTVEAGGKVTGGLGGTGRAGGEGGAAVVLVNAGVLTNSGALTGGTGGLGLGGGGDGGAGALLLPGATVINNAGGVIQGGVGGRGTVSAGATPTSPGIGGAGIEGSGVTVIDAGTITGGAGGAGTGWRPVAGQAIKFTGGVNSLEIWSTSVINGAVQAFSAADTLKLGGATDASFDLSKIGPSAQFQGFGQFAKVGASAWTLTGATTAVTPWTLAGGVLKIASDGALGDASGALTFNGGALETATDIAMTRAVIMAGAGTVVTDAGTTLTLGGPVSGVGALTKASDGTLVLTGANTYSGGTTISAGTLIGQATSFGSGAIHDGAALVVDQPTDASFANPIDGAGTFTKTGAGQLTYSGTGTLAGPTTVAAGAMSVNGSLASSAFTVMSGATLKGNGTVGGTTIQSGGTVAPGNSIGVLHVNGAFVQQAGSTYQVEVDPTSSNASDQIAVTGSATLQPGAGLTVIKTIPGNYHLGATYTVLSAAGGVTGTYVVNGLEPVSAFLALKDTYDSGHVYLTVVQTADPASAAQTPNQQAAAGGLPSGGDLTDAVLNSPTDAAARNAFDQLAGDGHAAAKGVLVSDSRLVRDLAIGRVQTLFCSPTGLVGGRPDDACPEDARLAAWGQVFGAWGRTDGNGNGGEANRSTGGFLIGADAPVAGIWRAGGFIGYSRSSVTLDGGQATADIANYHLGVYGGAQYGALGLRLGAAYSIDDIQTDRTVNLPNLAAEQLNAGYGAGSAQGFAQAGYGLDLGKAAVEPFVEAAYVSVRTNSFTEHGGIAALAGDAGVTDAVFSTVGVKPSLPLALGQIQASLHGLFGWRHDYGDVTPASTVRFIAGGSPFGVEGAPLARDAGIAEVGLDMRTDNALFGVTYGAQGWTHDFDQTVRANVRLVF